MEVQKIIEALIFAADGPMKPTQFLEIFQNEDFFGIKFDEDVLNDALAALLAKYQSDEFVFELKQIDGGYQFYTKKDYYPFVKHAVLAKSTRRMSRASLETLSIIAYKQPITKTEIEFIRGVNCDYAVSKLLEKNLHGELCEIVAGKKPGRANDQETILFWHRGLSLSDIALGHAMLEKAARLGVGQRLRYA